MDNSQPSYFAVIPASVRYDNSIPQGAKLLYGEISSLCNKEGYCWAGNTYFAQLYQTSERTIINWINSLKKSCHVSVSFTYVPGKKEIQTRKIRLNEAEKIKNIKKNEDTHVFNDTEVVKKSSPCGEKNFTTLGKNFHQVVKKTSKGGEKSFADNNTRNRTITTAAFLDHSETVTELLQGGEHAEAGRLTPKELKDALSSLDRRLFFDSDFYPKGALFLTEKGLDHGYLSWLHEQCENKEPRSFKGLFYILFFEESMVEEYLAGLKPLADIREQTVFNCPVCGNTHGQQYAECPECGLPENPLPDQITAYRQLLNLSAQIRNDYLNKEKSLYSECGKDYIKLKKELLNLKKEYGLKTLYEESS